MQLVRVLDLGLEFLLLGVKLNADILRAELGRKADGGFQIVGHGDDHHVGGGHDTVLVQHALLVQHVEQARQADGNADAGQRPVGVVFREIVIPAAGADRADLGMIQKRRLVDSAGVVVQPARNGQIDGEILLRHAKRAEQLRHGRKLVQTLIEDLISAAVLLQRGQDLAVRAADGDEGQNLVCLCFLYAARLDQQDADLVGADLVELVYRAHDIAGLFGQAQHGVEAVENLAVIHADLEPAQAERGERLIDDGRDLGLVRDGELAVADDVDIGLIELAEAAALGALAAVDLADLVAAERERKLVGVQRDILRERHGEIKAEGKVTVALREAVDLFFGLAAALGEKHVGALDDGRVERREAVESIALAQRRHDALHFLLLLRQKLHEAGERVRSDLSHGEPSFE